MEQVYSCRVIDDIAESKKVYALIQTDEGISVKDAETITLKEWVESKNGSEMFFIEVEDE